MTAAVGTLRPARARPVRVLRVLLLAGLGYATWVTLRSPAGFPGGWPRLAYDATFASCAALCLLRARRVADARGGWVSLGIAIAVVAVADVYQQHGPRTGYPGPADYGFLSFYPLAYIGLVLLIRGRARRLPVGTWLDGLTVGLGLATLTAALAYGALTGGSAGSVAAFVVGAAHPVGDLLLVIGVGALAVVVGTRAGPMWYALLAGVAADVVADSAYLAHTLDGTPRVPAWVDLLWLASTGAVATAAWLRQDPPRARHSSSTGTLLLVPISAAVTAVVVLVLGNTRQLPELATTLATLTVLASVARTALTFREVRVAAETRAQAVTDELTGLGNRRLFADRATAALREPGAQTALLLVDLDRFKEVNDALGHPVGDDLLRRLGPRLAGRLRPGETLARLGGDEFGVLVPGLADTDEAVAAAERLAGALDDPIRVDGVDVLLTASIGIAVAPQHGTDSATLLRKADVAMYEAKRLGTGHRLYRPTSDRHTRERLQTASDLRRALDRGELLCYYQPQVELATLAVTGVEALVRWAHPTRGVLVPDRFLSLAEQTGLMRPLTEVVVRSALADCAAWHDSGIPLEVSVNLSAESVLDQRLLARISELLGESRLPPGRLTVEITEGSLLAESERVRRTLVALRDLGVSVSIDDYGVGYSSLSYLQKLPIDELKLDRALVTPIARDSRAAAIVASTVDLAHALGVRLVAEGVEDAASLDALTGLGCDRAQGYHLARPMPAEKVAGWTRDWARSAASLPAHG
ncbi:MAG TPA: EAL domain-containing protein [Mycobacteriales bacterium]